MHYENDYFEESPMQSYIPSLVSLSFFKPLWCFIGLSPLFNNKFRLRLLCVFKNIWNALWEFIFWRVTYTVCHSSYIFIKSLRCMMGLNLFNSHLCNLRMKPNLFFVTFKTLMHDGNEHFEALLIQSQSEA